MFDCVVISSKPSIQSCTFNNIFSQGLMLFSPPSAVGKSSARLICDRRIYRWKWKNTIGLYWLVIVQYNWLVFGVASAPAMWQQAMDQILEGIPHVQCILDDMIISGATDQEHLDNLEEVLSRLSKHGLRANSSKCEFFKKRIEFCGHEISKLGLHKSQQKVNAVINAPRPENVSQVRSFVGLINYYHCWFETFIVSLFTI